MLATGLPTASVDELADAGAQRISIGGALARAAMTPILSAGTEMLESGSFAWLAACAPAGEVNRLMG